MRFAVVCRHFMRPCSPRLVRRLTGWAALACAFNGALAAPPASVAPPPAASAASAARASQAAVQGAERRQADEAQRQLRAERQAQDRQEAAVQQRREALCHTKKTQLQEAQAAAPTAPDRQGVIDRATVAMTLACQAAR